MSFVTTQPEALTAAAGSLQGIGSTMTAQNAAAAAPTTGVVPAAADEVSALQATQFSAYGTLYQHVSAQAAAIHEMFVHTLKTSGESYGATEGANAIAAGAAGTPSASSPLNIVGALGSNAMVTDIGTGASTAVMYIPSSLAPAMIGYLAASNAAGGGTAGAGIGGLFAPGGALGALGGLGGAAGAASSAASAASATAPAVSASMGQASLVGSLSAPPGWSAATSTSVGSAAASPSAGWAAAPESNTLAAMPGGMPGVGSGRSGYGFGAPRYGVKPTVMPKPAVV